MDTRFPEVRVRLTGTDGNAFAVMNRVCRALRAAGHGDVEKQFVAEATSGNYDRLLQTVLRWVSVE